MTSPEQRATPRYRLKPGSFAYYALGLAAVRDLSLGGVFIEDRQSTFSEGMELTLELRVDGESIPLRGVVRRSSPKVGFAVQFLDLHSDTKERLARYFCTQFGAP